MNGAINRTTAKSVTNHHRHDWVVFPLRGIKHILESA